MQGGLIWLCGGVMENELIELISSQGITVFFSVAMLFYIMKSQEKRDEMQNDREKNYRLLFEELTTKFNVINEIQKDVAKILNNLDK